MRKLQLLALALPIQLMAQTTFAPIGAKWTYTQHQAFAPDSGLFVVESMGDTTIDGIACAILAYTQGVNGCMPFHRYIGTSGDSVLFWSTPDSAFRTLYVFGGPIGNTWTMKADHNHPDSLQWTVVDTGSIQIGGLSLRTSQVQVQTVGGSLMSVLSSGTITERLGDLAYMLPWINGACDFEFNLPLRCYEDSEISWLNPQLAQCDLSSSIYEGQPLPVMVISPTMQAAGADFTMTDGSSGPFEVLDATGRSIVVLPAVHGPIRFALYRSGTYVVRSRTQPLQQVRVVVQ